MNKRVSVALATIMIFTGACTSTFLVSKDGKGYFLGSSSGAIYNLLCESGDLKRVLSDTTTLHEQMRDDLYRYNCTNERSGEKVKQIYAAMTPEQRKDLRTAFTKNGYDINYLPC